MVDPRIEALAKVLWPIMFPGAGEYDLLEMRSKKMMHRVAKQVMDNLITEHCSIVYRDPQLNSMW